MLKKQSIFKDKGAIIKHLIWVVAFYGSGIALGDTIDISQSGNNNSILLNQDNDNQTSNIKQIGIYNSLNFYQNYHSSEVQIIQNGTFNKIEFNHQDIQITEIIQEGNHQKLILFSN